MGAEARRLALGQTLTPTLPLPNLTPKSLHVRSKAFDRKSPVPIRLKTVQEVQLTLLPGAIILLVLVKGTEINQMQPR